MERPSCSTSGGQFEGIEEKEAFAVEGAVVVCAALGLLSLDAGVERAMAIHEETEVQERHLEVHISACCKIYNKDKGVHTVSHPGPTPRP